MLSYVPSGSLPTKQLFWDTPRITQVSQPVEESKSGAESTASGARHSAYSGDLLPTLPIASCGLRL